MPVAAVRPQHPFLLPSIPLPTLSIYPLPPLIISPPLLPLYTSPLLTTMDIIHMTITRSRLTSTILTSLTPRLTPIITTLPPNLNTHSTPLTTNLRSPYIPMGSPLGLHHWNYLRRNQDVAAPLVLMNCRSWWTLRRCRMSLTFSRSERTLENWGTLTSGAHIRAKKKTILRICFYVPPKY